MRSLLTSLIAVALAFPLTAQSAVVNRKLSGPMVGDARSFVVSNGRVVYTADQDVSQRVELYGVPADGGAPPVRLNGPLVSGGDVTGIALSPDGSTVVYVADAEVDGFRELFSAPFDGSTPPLKLNGPIAANGVVMFRLSPDGTRALYVEPGRRLHSVPIGGGESVFLATLNSLLTFQITRNSTHVLFANPALYAVPIDGSTAPVNLSGSLSVGPFEATPDGSRVAFAAPAVSSGVSRLYSQAIDGGSLLDLTSGLETAGYIRALALSMDGTRVVYLGDTGVSGQLRLTSVPVDGSSSGLELNGSMAADADVTSFEMSPDGESVVYLADQEVNESFRLHRVRVDGSAPDVLLSTQNFANHNGYEITPDGQHVVVRLGGLQSVPVAGGSVVQIAPAGGPFAFAAGGRRVVHFKPGSREIVFTPITGGTSVSLSPALPEEPSDFAVDGSRVVYLAEQGQANVIEVYSSWLDVQPTEHEPPTRSRSVTR